MHAAIDCEMSVRLGSTAEISSIQVSTKGYEVVAIHYLGMRHRQQVPKSVADSSEVSTSRGNWAGIGDGADTVPIYVRAVVVVLA